MTKELKPQKVKPLYRMVGGVEVPQSYNIAFMSRSHTYYKDQVKFWESKYMKIGISKSKGEHITIGHDGSNVIFPINLEEVKKSLPNVKPEDMVCMILNYNHIKIGKKVQQVNRDHEYQYKQAKEQLNKYEAHLPYKKAIAENRKAYRAQQEKEKKLKQYNKLKEELGL